MDRKKAATGKLFAKKKEDFVCDNCGAKMKGSGYTDHCSKCLFGKHVDINPGDRASDCGGVMEPMQTFSDRNGFSIYYRCTTCGIKKKVRAAQDDNHDLLIVFLSKNRNKNK